MSYLDTNLNPLDNQGEPHVDNGAWMKMDNVDQNKQWEVVSHKCITWVVGDPSNAFQPREALGFLLKIVGIAPNMHEKQWNSMMLSATEIARVLAGILNIIAIKPYDTWSALLDAASTAFEKQPDEFKKNLAFNGDGLIHCIGDPLPAAYNYLAGSEAWEDLLKWGMLHKYGKGTAALLEMSTWSERNFYVENMMLHLTAKNEVKQGRLSEESLTYAETAQGDDELDAEARLKHQHRVVRAVVAAIGRAGGLQTCLCTNPSDPDDFREMLFEAFEGEVHQFDGNSAFMLSRLTHILAARAPTLHQLLLDAEGQGEISACIVQLAATCPKDTADTDPKRLLTVAGIQRLERYLSTFSAWAASDTAKGLHLRARLEALSNRIANHINTGASSEFGTATTADNSSANPSTANLGIGYMGTGINTTQLKRVIEEGDNPGILADLNKMVSVADIDPRDILRVCFKGSTKKNPKRNSTTLTRMMGWGIINAGRIDPKLSVIHGYADEHGPSYLGQLVGDALVDNHLMEPENVTDLVFTELWKAMRGRTWKSALDFYNQLIIPLLNQGPCGGTLSLTEVKPIPTALVWKDVVNNQRLVMLIAAILEGVGIPHEGPNGFPAQLIIANNFVTYHGGISPKQTAAILDAIADFLNGILGEGSTLINNERDPTNLEAPCSDTFLRPTGTALGPRRHFFEFCKRVVEANKLRREYAQIAEMPSFVTGMGVAQFAYVQDDEAKRHCNEERDTTYKSRRQLAKERQAEQNGGARTAATTTPRGFPTVADPQRQLDYTNAVVTYENQGKVLVVGPATNGQMTKYDAEKLRAGLGPNACLAHLCTVGLLNCKDGCPKQGDPAHQAGGALHTWPNDVPKRKEFNLKRTSDKGKGGGDKGKGKGGGKGKGKGGGKGKGKGKGKQNM